MLHHTLGCKKDNLDGSLSFHLSGLSNNAKLELVAAPANHLTGRSGECTLGLHKLEDGSRKTAKVDSSSSLSLLEVIAQLAPEVAHPVVHVQYMGRTVATGVLASPWESLVAPRPSFASHPV
jgi:hypothetical protein